MNALLVKVASVTGGSGCLGSAISKADAQEGALARIGSKSPASIGIATTEIYTQGGMADGFPGNMAELHQVQALAQQTQKQSGQLAIRVNHASIGTPVKPPICIPPHGYRTSDRNLQNRHKFRLVESDAALLTRRCEESHSSAGSTRGPSHSENHSDPENYA